MLYSPVRKWLKAWVAISTASLGIGTTCNCANALLDNCHLLPQYMLWILELSDCALTLPLGAGPYPVILRKSLDTGTKSHTHSVLSGLNQSWFFPYQTCTALIKHFSGITDDFGLTTTPFVNFEQLTYNVNVLSKKLIFENVDLKIKLFFCGIISTKISNFSCFTFLQS